MSAVRVLIHLKPEIPDPQGETLCRSLKQGGFDEVQAVRVGRSLELEIGEILTGESIAERVEIMCQRVLIHSQIESYEIIEG